MYKLFDLKLFILLFDFTIDEYEKAK